jgi:hypothetical protein
MHINIIVKIAAIAMLTGCSHSVRNPYPEWPPLTVSSPEKGVSITGNYQTISEPHQQLDWLMKSLLSFLTEEEVKSSNITAISIGYEVEQNDHYLEVTVRQDESIFYKFSLKEDRDFKCTSEGIQIIRDWHFVNINFGIAWEKNYYTFSQAKDGSLILRDTTYFKGLVFFILPVQGENVTWWRWLSMEN